MGLVPKAETSTGRPTSSTATRRGNQFIGSIRLESCRVTVSSWELENKVGIERVAVLRHRLSGMVPLVAHQPSPGVAQGWFSVLLVHVEVSVTKAPGLDVGPAVEQLEELLEVVENSFFFSFSHFSNFRVSVSKFILVLWFYSSFVARVKRN